MLERNGDRSEGRGLGRRVLRTFKAGVGLTTLAALLAAQPAAVLAQQAADPYANRYVPYGSPLDPTGQAGAGTTNGQPDANGRGGFVQQAQPIEPVDVNDASERDSDQSETDRPRTVRDGEAQSAAAPTLRRPAPPNEFERFVERRVGKRLPRFGADLLVPETRDFATPTVSSVPQDYVLNAGDEIFIGLSGSIDGTVDAKIDNDGRIFLPKVGPVRVAGVRYGDLRSVLSRAISSQYRDFKVTAAVSRLRGIRVYVTGFANNPGAFSVNSLSTMANAVLAAGGPSSGGSFRSIKLYRNGELVSDFDLYDLIRNGNRSRDAVLQNEDVLYIQPLGEQVAITGSVNSEAIYEVKPGETLDALLRFAGGPNVLADKSRAILYRLSDRDAITGKELPRDQLAQARAEGGDLLQVLSAGSLQQPVERQAVVVRVEGEVNRPGNYFVAPGTSLGQVMELAGGTTQRAFVYGANLQRVTVRQQQRESFLEAVRQLELTLAAAPLTGDTTVAEGTRNAQLASARAVLDRLRQTEPDGRIVLDTKPTDRVLPAQLTVENNDRIYIPPRPSTVGVFGAVYRPASFLVEGVTPRRVSQYVAMAGGPLRAADKGQIFVVRANGAVLSRKTGALSAVVLPGDVIFVPVKTESSSVWAKILQISSVVFQLGLAAATVVAVTQ